MFNAVYQLLIIYCLLVDVLPMTTTTYDIRELHLIVELDRMSQLALQWI